MAKEIEYRRLLTPEDEVRIRFVKNRGRILKFVVQYYTKIKKHWLTVMRIDNCHGYPHKHIYHLHKKEFMLVLPKDNNIAFTEAQNFIKNNFKKIKENFLFSQ
jgi:hypothetical protein